MKKSILSIGLIFLTLGLFAQDFEVPKDYKLKKKGDFTKYENDVVKCFDWLMATPANEQTDKRKKANGFMMEWMVGSPNLTIELNTNIVTFTDSGDLLLIFMGGWTKYAITSNDYKDKKAGNLAGIEAVIEFYQKNKEYLGENKEVEKFVDMKNNGTLKEFIDKKA